MRKNKLRVILAVLLCSLISCKNQNKKAEIAQQKPNVIFICVDDLRPELGCYGADYIRSPNIDSLAAESVIFTNHFVNIPTCGASRCSMLTGMLPHSRGHLSNEAIREFISGQPESEVPETFIHHLRRNGYYTVGIGKISHYADGLLYDYTDSTGAMRELPYSWDELVFDAGKWKTGWNAFFGYADGTNRQSMNRKVKPYEKGNVDDDGYPDGLTARLAVQKLKELKGKDQPFFLGVGFFKPHLPFNAPAKYWDIYDEETIPLTPSAELPKNVNRASLHESGEFNGYVAGDEKASLDKPVSDTYARKLRHAYFAAISYVDAQIGKVLDEIEKLGIEDNTIVVIWGDHGWHLGDHHIWGKHTIFERALKSPLLIKAPNTQNKKVVCNRVVSAIDIYPTIIELCGLQMPHKTDGASLANLMRNPVSADWRDISYGYFRNGISMRTKEFRLTRYFRDELPVVELFDHAADPNEIENIANGHAEIVERLMPLWEEGDTGLFQQFSNSK